MDERIETTLLEFKNSNFLIEVIKDHDGLSHIRIQQNSTHTEEKSSIQINPTILTDFIKVLENYHAKYFNQPSKKLKNINYSDQQKIQERYFKGVTIEDLALQFGQTPELITMVLRNRGLPIVDNKLPKPRYRGPRKRS